MTTNTIQLRNVSVEFSSPNYRYSTLKEYVINYLKGKRGHQVIRALDGISLDVERGESVALLGHNGCGKSTLLRVIAGIFEPPGAEIRVHGRVAPMIELGAGFDSDLTGRENVFLAGSLMGLSRRVIEDRFDEVVAFSEIAEFIDIPFKNYSSGMQARLGFACATAFDPDVLLIDEVLAVGDANFAQKCLIRMHELQRRGATLVLVSHDAATVERFCQRGVVFLRGKKIFDGPVSEALAVHKKTLAKRMREAYEADVRSGYSAVDEVQPACEVSARLDGTQSEGQHLVSNEPFKVAVDVDLHNSDRFCDGITFGIGLVRVPGLWLGGYNNLQSGHVVNTEVIRGLHSLKLEYHFPKGLPWLNNGEYQIVFGVHDSRLARSIFLGTVLTFTVKNHLSVDVLGSENDICLLGAGMCQFSCDAGGLCVAGAMA